MSIACLAPPRALWRWPRSQPRGLFLLQDGGAARPEHRRNRTQNAGGQREGERAREVRRGGGRAYHGRQCSRRGRGRGRGGREAGQGIVFKIPGVCRAQSSAWLSIVKTDLTFIILYI